MTDTELREIVKDLVASQIETRTTLQALFKETAAQFKESRDQFKETRDQFKEIRDQSKETDAEIKAVAQQIKETTAQMKETDRKLKDMGRNLGNIGERFGSFTEGLAYPSLRKVLREKYSIENTVANIVKDLPNGGQMEFDAFGYTNGNVNNAVIVEVKSHLQSKHIKEFKAELQKFGKVFPEFADKHLYGILATVRIVPKELKAEIFSNGLHLATIHDNIFDFKQNPKATDFNI
jgi:hypothetical protein